MRVLLLLGLVLVLGGLCGCATLTKSPGEVRNTYKRIVEYDMRMMSEDWNALWLMDRPSRLTRWQMR